MAAAKHLPDRCALDDIAGSDANISAAARVVNIWNQRHFTLMEPDRRALWSYMKEGAWRRRGKALGNNSIDGWKFWQDFHKTRTEEVDYDKCTIARWMILVAVNKGLKGISQDVRDVIKDRYGEQAITMFAGPVATDRPITPIHRLWNENWVKEEDDEKKELTIEKPTSQVPKKSGVKAHHKTSQPKSSKTSLANPPSVDKKTNAKTKSTPNTSTNVKVEPSATATLAAHSSQAVPAPVPSVPKKRKLVSDEIYDNFGLKLKRVSPGLGSNM